MTITKSVRCILLAAVFVFFAGGVHAKEKITPLWELIEFSDAICLVKVKEVVFWKKPHDYIHERNRVEVLKVLKWPGKPPNELEVVSRRPDPALGQSEDPPAEFPEKGSQALLFLTKNSDGDWKLTDSQEGLWEFDGKEFTNPFRPSLDYLEKRVKTIDIDKK